MANFHKILILNILAILLLLNIAFGEPTEPLKVLITGFEPFGNHQINPTHELMRFVRERPQTVCSETLLVEAITLPVVYFASWEVLEQKIATFKPDVVIAFGYAANSKAIRIELIARNEDRGIADNQGNCHLGTIVAGGQEQYPSSLPVQEIQMALQTKNIAVITSQDAGGYLCNHIFYQLMCHASKKPDIQAGFIHIPLWQVPGDSGLLATLQTLLNVLLNTRKP